MPLRLMCATAVSAHLFTIPEAGVWSCLNGHVLGSLWTTGSKISQHLRSCQTACCCNNHSYTQR
jgi:hypothetical protein